MTTYLVMVEHEDGNPKNGSAIAYADESCRTLERCQSQAQRLTETGHGKCVIGKFVPVDTLGKDKAFNAPLLKLCSKKYRGD